MSVTPERTLQLGRLGRTVGLDGGLLFHADGNAEAALVAPGLEVLVDGHGPMRIRESRRHNRGIVVHFEGIRRIERAGRLTNAVVSVDAALLPEDVLPVSLTDGLLGLPVLLGGRTVGTVASVAGASGHEFLTLEPGGEMLPLAAPYVEVAEDRILLVDPPAGLI